MHGLVALMEIQASRLGARASDRDGEPMLLLDQDRARWDQLLIRRGLAALDAGRRSSAARLGPYALQAAIAACHARARRPTTPTGSGSSRSTTRSRSSTRSPVVELNRAVALSRWPSGRRPASSSSTRWRTSPRCARTTCCRACAATCWPGSAARDEARAEFERAAAMTRNARERDLLLARAAACM